MGKKGLISVFSVAGSMSVWDTQSLGSFFERVFVVMRWSLYMQTR